jgi:hypothetical protein
MSGGKGGTTTSETKIPQYIEDASKSNLALADKLSNIGYVPYYGPDVAAFNPMQQAAFQGTQQAASAFGMPTGEGQYMPQATQFAGGIQGYSSAPMFEQARQNLAQYRPAQAQYMDSFFMNPQSGSAGVNAAPIGAAQGYSPQGYTNTSPLGAQPIDISRSGKG